MSDDLLSTERRARALEDVDWAVKQDYFGATTRATIAAALEGPAQGAIDRVVQRVAELPDRTSPDDWPEAMLVTADELRAILRDEVAAPPPEAPPWQPTLTEDEWDIVEDGVNCLADESARNAEMWAGRSRERRYHNEATSERAVVEKIRAWRAMAAPAGATPQEDTP